MPKPPLAVVSLGIVVSLGLMAVGPGDRPEKLDLPAIENAYRLTPRLVSGGEPRGVEAFRALRDLGIGTVISVDGSRPDVESARAVGIRYVHLPVGYDGIPADRAARIVEAARSMPGPIFLHCHHGKHRGPAAAAICEMALEGWDVNRAEAWLKVAGTSADYRGLFASVRGFRPEAPGPARALAPPADFPEVAEVPPLVDRMVEVDGRWDRLKAVRKASFAPTPACPDPAHEALLLSEAFREAARKEVVGDRGEDFARRMAEAADDAEALGKDIAEFRRDPTSTPARQAAEASNARVERACASCHAAHRDVR